MERKGGLTMIALLLVSVVASCNAPLRPLDSGSPIHRRDDAAFERAPSSASASARPALPVPPSAGLGAQAAPSECGADADCTLARLDSVTHACCSCNLVAIRKAEEKAFQARCQDDDKPCVLSCLQSPDIRARCIDGSCRVGH